MAAAIGWELRLGALPIPAAVLVSVALLAGCGSDNADTTTGAGSANSTTTSTVPEEPKNPDATPQPFNVSSLLNGDAKPTLPSGDANKVAVIAQAPLEKTSGLDAATLTFAFRNNTDKAISHVDWTATAREPRPQ